MQRHQRTNLAALLMVMTGAGACGLQKQSPWEMRAGSKTVQSIQIPKGNFAGHLRQQLRSTATPLTLQPQPVSPHLELPALGNRYTFSYDGVPLCDVAITAVSTGPQDNKGWLLGDVPELSADALQSLTDSDSQLVKDLLEDELITQGKAGIQHIISTSTCIGLPAPETTAPPRKLTRIEFRDTEQKAWLAYADAEGVHRLTPLGYGATAATANIYANNPLVIPTELTAFPLTGLRLSVEEDDEAILANDFFEVRQPDNDAEGPVTVSDEGAFNFAVSDPRFVETSLFTNAYRIHGWFKSLGFTDTGFGVLRIGIHPNFEQNPNNAYYEATSESVNIYVGNGDGIRRRNMGVDADVMFHEYSHHVIYRLALHQGPETTVLHEALADYFTYAKTNNSCLAESICMGDHRGCASASCLRTGDNTMTLDEAPPEPHPRSQVISGLLWDIRRGQSEPSRFDSLILQTLTILLRDSGYTHFLTALAIADTRSGGLGICRELVEKSKTRGLTEFVQGVDCKLLEEIERSRLDTAAPGAIPEQIPQPTNPSLPNEAEAINGEPSSPGQAPQRSSTSGHVLCGVTDQHQETNWFLLALLSSPVLLALGWRNRQY